MLLSRNYEFQLNTNLYFTSDELKQIIKMCLHRKSMIRLIYQSCIKNKGIAIILIIELTSNREKVKNVFEVHKGYLPDFRQNSLNSDK